jgi:hypothetical protein
MATVIERVEIAPNYARGFTFAWTVSREFADPAPWYFWVERGETPSGPWTAFSPRIVQAYGYQDTRRLLVPKDPQLYFRVKLTTPNGTYYSDVRSPYGDLARTEFLQAREIMRTEVVQAQKKAGILGQVWLKSIFGPVCSSCVDPVTGTVTNPDCKQCFGTGRQPGYHGPYPVWMVFSPRQRNKHMKPDEMGPHEDYVHSVRLIGSPVLKKDDVIVDPNSDRRYYVNDVTNVMELRRIPLVQQLEAREAPTTEQIYKI